MGESRVRQHLARMVATLTILGSLMALALTQVSAQGPFTVVASGLDNPRGLAFGPEGALYVAEAGSGGDGPCVPSPEGGEVCFGNSGAITRVWHGTQERVVTGLPSLAAPLDDPDNPGGEALGPQDISLLGRGTAFISVGLGADPDVRDQIAQFSGFGMLLQMAASGRTRAVADVAAFEAVANPDGGEIDSNPNAVLTLPGKRIVVDAGGNDLLEIRPNGKISTIAVFPDRLVDAPPFLGLPPGTQIPMQAVPTSVVQGPDGAYYVGQLTGFPFPVGEARVYRVVPGQSPTIFADGFTNIIDIAFDSDGNLYVLEIAKNGLLSGDPTGALIQVAPDGTQTEIASAGLVAPAGLTVGPDGALYVSNFGVFADIGEVVRIEP